jgi:hypothetical protein
MTWVQVTQLRLTHLLTIGDGLVAQIPALIISTAAGLVVTRVATETGYRPATRCAVIWESDGIGLDGWHSGDSRDDSGHA